MNTLLHAIERATGDAIFAVIGFTVAVVVFALPTAIVVALWTRNCDRAMEASRKAFVFGLVVMGAIATSLLLALIAAVVQHPYTKY